MTDQSLQRRVKTALDETRLLILGAQILFGFHLNGAFQKGFDELSTASRALHAASFLLMAIAIAALIAPSLQHRIVDKGRATPRILGVTSTFAACALFPFALALGIDLYTVLGFRFGAAAGAAAGMLFTGLALAAWFVAEWLLKTRLARRSRMRRTEDTPIETRVEHMLTEARVLLPGAQALLGFQLAVLLTEAFAQLPGISRLLHAAALLSTALAVILLMAPAAFHRITFEGESTESFHALGSALVLAAAAPLALGIVLEMYVAVAKAVDSASVGLSAAIVLAAIVAGLWLALPLALRARHAGVA
jgi:hypothetical protein